VTDYRNNFHKEYQKLNPAQKQAVDTIEGPVMVVAGAGTGKTQTIALRIANILSKTDTPPSSILCLTFKDNASFNMRKRLLEIIGPTAYSVSIHTFHSFCNMVISTNPDLFPQTNLRSIEEIDKIEIIGNIIENLPVTSPLKPTGEPLYYLSTCISSIQTLKREGFSPKSFLNLLNQQQIFIDNLKPLYDQLKSLRGSISFETEFLTLFQKILENPHTPANFKSLFSSKYRLFQDGFYTTGKAKNPATNFKNDILSVFDQIKNNLAKQFELQKVYKTYQHQLKKLSFYDFDDMINFVTSKFSKNPEFLKQYQEQILYILVDEFQDSNNSQIKLLDQLSSYFDNPNLFVVGDDDQSIFRFQGASVENIINFNKKYSPQVFVLVNNYRSHQLILDSARQVISQNQLQLVKHIKNIDKNLLSQVDFDPDPINLYSAQTPTHQAVLVVDKIKALIASGTLPSNIAILYRQHQDADLVEKLLLNSQIKFNRHKQNSLNENSINYFIRILKAVANPSDNFAIFSFLCLPFLGISSTTLLKINYKTKKLKISLLDYLHSPHLKSKKIKKYLSILADCYREVENMPLDRLFVYIADQFSYLSYLNSLTNNYPSISQFYNLFAYLKSYQQTHPKAHLDDFTKRLGLLLANNLSIPQTFVPSDDSAISLMTVHSAKGLEFEHVFIINCTDGLWGNSRARNTLPLPLGIISTNLDNDQNEEDRRLFYVALTRAKKQIYLFYPQTKDNGKNISPCQFIFEINPKNIDSNTVCRPVNSADLVNLLTPSANYFLANQNQELIENYLKTSYKFNITHLNSYLACPYCYFYKTILKIPSVKSSKASLGTAVHTTLSYLHQNPKSTLKKLTEVLELSLKQENLAEKDYLDMFALGLDILKKYLVDHPDLRGVYKLEQNFSSNNLFFEGIPITGKIDKIEILPTTTDGKKNIIVTDFKTGKFNYTKIATKFDHTGGDYFRQILFYKLLLDLSPKLNYHFLQGQIEFVEPDPKNDKFTRVINFSDQDMDNLKSLIKDTYQNIIDLKFPINPDCKNRDHLHQL